MLDEVAGAIQAPIDGSTEFFEKLLKGATSWYRSFLKLTSKGTMSPERCTEIRSMKKNNGDLRFRALARVSSQDWHTQVTKQLLQIDFKIEENFNTLFDAKKRETLFVGSDCLKKGLSDLARYMLNGWSGTLHGSNSYRGWVMTGFGIWTQLRGLEFVHKSLLPKINFLIQKEHGLEMCLNTGGIILKPPKSTELFTHMDASMADMLRRTEKDLTMKKWVEDYGLQSLYHVKGGVGEGRTCVLAPMDSKRFRILLLLAHPKHHHEGMPSLTDDDWTNSKGAIPYAWDNNLDMVNRVLKILESSQATFDNQEDNKWWSSLSKAEQQSISYKSVSDFIPLEMTPLCVPGNTESYIVKFAHGFPHMVEPGQRPRLSAVLHPKIRCKTCETAIERHESLFQAAAGDEEAKKKLCECDRFLTFTQNSGSPHRHPESEVFLMEFFGSLYCQPAASSAAPPAAEEKDLEEAAEAETTASATPAPAEAPAEAPTAPAPEAEAVSDCLALFFCRCLD